MMTIADSITNQIAQERESIITLRRELHSTPELAFEEWKTADFITGYLKAQGIDVKTGIGVTGILGLLHGSKKGKTLMLRADMDGLPIQEPVDRPYRSVIENQSHACGHDFNMTLVLATARILASRRDQFAGTAAFVFQPADEPQLGAKRMIDDGLFDLVQPDMIIAQHAMDNVPTGKIIAQAGRIWPSSNMINVTIRGQRGEFNSPDTGVDSTLITAEIVSALYAMMHRISPVRDEVFFRVNSIKTLADTDGPFAEIGMRLASYQKQSQKVLRIRIEEIIQGITRAFGAKCSIEDTLIIPPVINDPVVSQALIDISNDVVGDENVIQDWRNLFSDDIGVFMDSIPGCQFAVGTYNPGKGTGPFHRAEYDIDEDALPLGVEIMSKAALRLLS